MTEIFINTSDDMVPGEVGCGSVFNREHREIPISFRCIRQANIDEYLEFVKENNLMHMVNRNITNMKFFLIEILD